MPMKQSEITLFSMSAVALHTVHTVTDITLFCYPIVCSATKCNHAEPVEVSQLSELSSDSASSEQRTSDRQHQFPHSSLSCGTTHPRICSTENIRIRTKKMFFVPRQTVRTTTLLFFQKGFCTFIYYAPAKQTK